VHPVRTPSCDFLTFRQRSGALRQKLVHNSRLCKMAVVPANLSSIAGIVNPTDAVKVSSAASEALGDSLKDFLEAAMKIAQIDEAIMSARAAAPRQEDSEAFKWHEVSIKALMWTRASMAEQQSISLELLKNVAVSQRPSAPTSQLVLSGAPMSSLSATAAPFALETPKSVADAAVRTSKLITPAQAGARVAKGELNAGSLRADLERLKEYGAQQCLIVRRIKRLGLGSPEILRKHFSSFGGVKEMLISHSFEKKSAKCRADRLRPAALGFIVMDSVEGAQAALRAGPTLLIGEVDVEVTIFEPLEQLQQRDGVEGSALASFH